MNVAIPGTHEPGFIPPPLHSFARDWWTMGECSVHVSRDPAGREGAMLWHLSISAPNRHPTWDEIKTARYRLLPLDLTFGMLLPPPDEYVNMPEQDHVFHLWEIEV